MSKPRVLIIEDEHIESQNLEVLLKANGYEISGSVASGEEAIEIIHKNQPDLIIVDIKLQGDIDGIETVSRINKKYNIPFIYLSSYSDNETLNRVELTEPSGFLTKPFNTNDLKIALRIAIYKHSLDQKLKESEARYKILYENNPLMIFTISSDLKIISANKHAHYDLGYKDDELPGKDFIDISHIENQKMVENNLVQCIENAPKTYSWESKILHKEGHSIWIREVACTLINNPDHILVTCENITQQKFAEEKILETNKLLKMVTDEASDLIAIVDLDGKRLYNSKSYAKILGDPESLTGTNSFREIHPDDRERIKQLFADTIQTGIGKLTQYRYLLNNNTIIHIESQGNLIRNSKGEPEKVLIVARDITERKQSEEKLAEYNEELKAINASKDKLFSIIAHDLRSPFTSILGFSEYMAKYYKDITKTELHEYSNMLYHSAQNIFNLLENLLHWSRMRTSKFEFIPAEFNLGDTIQRVYNIFSLNADEKKIDLAIEDGNDFKVYTDENIVFTVLRNLVSNAIKFTPSGGNVKITSKKVSDRIIVTVSDSGIGISKENLGKLFEEGVHLSIEGTENEKGTGLGLILCKELLYQCGEKIFVESLIGKGSTFSFTLSFR